jgi:hypothetical protein
MQSINRIVFNKTLPESFFHIPISIYSSLPFGKSEDPNLILSLFNDESDRNKIIIYTDHKKLRLVGIFPTTGTDAYFGFWETTDDSLLNAKAFALLQEDAIQNKKTKIIGPLNFNTYQSYRLRLNNPSWIKFDQEPVNPPYYPSLLEQNGFAPDLFFESRMIKQTDIPDVYLAKEKLLKEFEAIAFEYIPVNPETWREYEMEIFELVQDVFGANPFYKSISFEQFTTLYNQNFASRLCPHSSVLFKEKKSDRLVSLSFCQPNYESLSQPTSYVPTYELDFKKIKHKVLLVKSVGVHPEFRQQNLMNFMAAYAMLSFRQLYDEVIFCTSRQDNLSNNFTRYLQYEKAEYALFRKLLPIDTSSVPVN